MSEEINAALPQVVIYTGMMCGYCSAAMRLLKDKGVDFTEIKVSMHADKRREMIERSGHHTVPQIFIDDRPVGGYDDLAALDQRGELNTLLGINT
jgi:glutaredoxin 3